MDRTYRSSTAPSAIDNDALRTLGISRDASIEDIRAAYRRRARVTHPDRHGGSDADEFRAVQAAYERLTKRGEPSTARLDTINVGGVDTQRSWDTYFSGFQFSVGGLTREPFALHRHRAPGSIWVGERDLVQAPSRMRKRLPHTYIVLHGLLFPLTRPSARLLAMDLVYLDPTSACPYALVARHRSWLLVRQTDGRLLAQNSRRGFSRLGGYAAFSDASGAVEPTGERIFPPFEAPLVF